VAESKQPNDGFGSRQIAGLAGFAASHAKAVVAGLAALSVVLGVAAVVGLRPASGADSLVPKAASASVATDAVRKDFGGDPIIVMVEENLRPLLLTTDIGRLLQLEGCLGGRTPKGVIPYGGANGPCAAIAKSGSVKAVYGPATFLNEAANQISGAVGGELQAVASKIRAASEAARKQALAQGLGEAAAKQAATAAGAAEQKRQLVVLARLQAQSGLQGLPSIADTGFVTQVALDPARGADAPNPRFSYLFPSRNAALIQVRPRPGLSGAATRELITNVNKATKLSIFKLKYGGRYLVTGAPVLAESLADDVAGGALPLLLVALLMMGLVLALAFRVRLRLLPLALAGAAAAIVFGAMALLGLPLTVAAVGGVPVLIGLAVDYAVQLQARTVEAEANAGVERESEVVVAAASFGGPPIVAAAAATAAGFLALLLSPVPMVRGFGLVLFAGVAVALVVAFSGGSAALVRLRPPRIGGRAASQLDASVRGAGALLGGLRPVRFIGEKLGALRQLSAAKPKAVIAIAIVLALSGWIADSQLQVESDITRLVPAGTPALVALNSLQRETGVAGEVDILLSGERVTAPETLKWLAGVQKGALARWGFSEKQGCRGASLCPGVSIADLPIGTAKTDAEVKAALAAVPSYFRSAVLTENGRAALAAFGVRLMPLTDQQKVFDDLRARVSKPPPGVTASVAGLPVIAAEANARLADPNSRRWITLAAVALVALVLLLVLRSVARVIVPLGATVLATGWASLLLWLLGVELNPLSAALGALVIAIATEFAVLISERHWAEMRAGRNSAAAISRAMATTGRAVAISGLTVVTGFAVLGFSDIRVLRDFGYATVIDLAVALLAVVVIVPAGLRLLAARAAAPPEAGEAGT